MRNQRLLVKVVPKIVTMNASTVMAIKMLTRRFYQKLGILIKEECHRNLNRLQQVQHKYLCMLIDDSSSQVEKKLISLCCFLHQCHTEKVWWIVDTQILSFCTSTYGNSHYNAPVILHRILSSLLIINSSQHHESSK